MYHIEKTYNGITTRSRRSYEETETIDLAIEIWLNDLEDTGWIEETTDETGYILKFTPDSNIGEIQFRIFDDDIHRDKNGHRCEGDYYSIDKQYLPGKYHFGNENREPGDPEECHDFASMSWDEYENWLRNTGGCIIGERHDDDWDNGDDDYDDIANCYWDDIDDMYVPFPRNDDDEDDDDDYDIEDDE